MGARTGRRRACSHSQRPHPGPLSCPSWELAEKGAWAARLQGQLAVRPADGAGDPLGEQVRTNSKVPASGQLHALGADASRCIPECCGDRKPRSSQGNFCGTLH